MSNHGGHEHAARPVAVAGRGRWRWRAATTGGGPGDDDLPGCASTAGEEVGLPDARNRGGTTAAAAGRAARRAGVAVQPAIAARAPGTDVVPGATGSAWVVHGVGAAVPPGAPGVGGRDAVLAGAPGAAVGYDARAINGAALAAVARRG